MLLHSALWGATLAGLAIVAGWATEARFAAGALPVRLRGPPVAVSAEPPAGADGELRVVVAALLSPRRSLAVHGRLLDLLGARLGRPVRIVQRRTYAEVNELLLDDPAAIGFICAGAFVAAEERGLEVLAVPVVRGKSTYHSYIIAAASSDAASFDDLRGGSFAFMDPLSASGCLYPISLLAERGVAADEFFARVSWTGSHEGSVEAVAHGAVDAAAVDSLVYEYLREHAPEIVAGTRVVVLSPPFAIAPVVASSRVPVDLRERVKRILVGLHETPEGRQALADSAIDRFDEVRLEDYEPIRVMYAAVERFRRR